VKKRIKKMIDRLMGTSQAMSDRHMPIAPNRKARRADFAIRQAALAAPIRRKHEKRGAPGRASKGRKPHRVS
jgi:hypothetical protein